jgi:acyl-CoA reductase-like NAD-dependent aldehyde dehydrogenase
VAERREELAQTLTAEMGKPIVQSRNELVALADRLDFFLHAVPEVLADETVREDGNLAERLSYDPLGVVANVSAWNYPYFIGTNVFVPALLAGNAVLYKPSELASLTGLAIAEMLHGAGVPEDVFACLTGTAATGMAVVSQPVQGVFFTGSHATGRKIATAVAGRLLRLQLELGGKDPVYVCEDVDIAKAAASVAEGAFYNAGQSCCAVERVYIHERIAQSFLDAFVDTVRSFETGDPRELNTFIGPLARRAQIDVLEAQVADALAKGARLLCGGQRIDKPGFYFEPTVLTEVTHAMEVMREESFGPLVGVQAVASDEEAEHRMADTRYGLTAGVYTRDPERARRLLSRLDAGSVYWNCCDRVSPRLPWSGRRDSGLGSTLGREGIRAFVQPRAWHLRSA